MSDNDLWGTSVKAPSTPGQSGLVANVRAGVEEGFGGTIGTIWDALVNPRAIVDQAWNVAAKMTGAKPVAQPVTVGHLMNLAAGANNPELVTANTPAERAVRTVAAGAGGALLPAGDALTVGRMLANGLIGAGAGAGSAAAQEAAPDNLKPVASVLGGLVGGLGAAGVESGLRAAAGAGARAVEPIVAAASPAAAERQAGSILASRAENPEAVAAAVEPGSQPIVAGSEPTTFQQTGDMGLGALEREQQTKNPVPFQERRAAQNEARTAALADIQSGGDPNAVATGIKANFDKLDADTQAHVDDLVTQAQDRVAALKGSGTPESYGEATRAAINEAETATRARESGLWKAIDPEGDLTGNVATTRQAANEIVGSIPKTAKPMSGEEAGIFDAAREMALLSPVQDLIALRSRVSTEMRNELIANGRSPSYARLTQLRGAIQDNLAHTISQEVANDAAAVSRGALAPEDAAAARIQGWIDEYRAQRESQAVGGGGEGLAQPPPQGPPPSVAADGAGLPQEGGPAGAPGDQGLQAGESVGAAPTFDEEAAARLAAATAATKDRALRFGLNPVSSVTAKAGAHDLFKLPEGRVPEKFFHPGPTGYTDMQALFSAVGEERALPIIADYASASLKRAAMREDGTLDPVKAARWSAAHRDALRALPADVRGKFTDAAQAAHAVTAASAARALTLKGFQQGAIGKIMGLSSPEDVVKTVGQILNSRTSVSEMRILADAARKAGPDAVAGLRQAVADHIASKLIGNTEAGTSGLALIKADQFQTFVRQNRAALKTVFTDDEVSSMDAIARDIQRAKRSENAVKIPAQSNTAQDVAGVLKNARSTGKVGRTVINAIATAVGATHGPIGAVTGLLGAAAVQAMREVGISRVDELVTQALLHPEIARELLKKAGPRGAPAAGRPLANTIRRVAIGAGAALDSGS